MSGYDRWKLYCLFLGLIAMSCYVGHLILLETVQ